MRILYGVCWRHNIPATLFGIEMSTSYKALDLSELDKLYGTPAENSVKKELPQLNEAYRLWLELSPFLLIASSDGKRGDCSPRGDIPGSLFRILDDRHIAIPDRRGNNRIDTLRNIARNPSVALLFLIPGISETMRINGSAYVTDDASLCDSFIVGNSTPATVTVVTIESVYFQCSRAVKRASLWSGDIGRKTEVPTAGQMLAAAITDFNGVIYDATLEERVNQSLY